MSSIKSTKYNKNIEDPIIYLQIKNNLGWMMEVIIQRDRTQKSLSYNSYVNFFLGDTKIVISDIFDTRGISKLVDSYRIETSKVIYDDEFGPKNNKEKIKMMISINDGQVEKSTQPLSKKKNSIIQTIIKTIKELESIIDLIRDLRSLDIYTYTREQLNDKIVARTKIELDADIITLLSPQILEQDANSMAILLRIHNHNVYLVNQTVQNQIKIFCSKLHTFDKIIKVISFTPFILSLINSLLPFLYGASENLFSLSYIAISSAISGIAYKYGPKMIFRYAPSIIFKIIPRILSYFVRNNILPRIDILPN